MDLQYKKIVCLPLLMGIIFVYGHPVPAYAHTGINSAPTMSCGSIDSADLTTHVSNQIDNRINSVASSTGMFIFDDHSMSTSTPWTRNALSWTQAGVPLDFTGVAAWNNGADYMHPQQGGTLISPRHFLAASHYAIAASSTVGFIDSSGNHIERRVVGSMNITGTDIQVEVLDSDVPDSITYYPIMASSTLEGSLQQFSPQAIDVPIVTFDQEAKAIVRKMNLMSNRYIEHQTYLETSRKEFSEPIVGGDSGQPGFIVIDNRPVLLFTHLGTTEGPNIGNYINQINAAMTSLGGGYQVTQYTPSCFTFNIIDHPSVFNFSQNSDNAYIELGEKTQPATSTPFRQYVAVDPDAGDTLTYSIYRYAKIANGGYYDVDPTPFWRLDSATGELYQLAPIDFETAGDINEYYIFVSATDDGPAHASSTWSSEIAIYNQNDQPTFAGEPLSFSIAENSSVGSVVGTVTATDTDATQQTYYSIVDGNEGGSFSIASSTGIITVINSSPLDYEARHSISLVVEASSTLGTNFIVDGGDINYATTTVTINITDVSESSGGGNSGGGSTGGGGGGGGGSSEGIIYYNRPNQATSTSSGLKTIVINGVTYTMTPIASGASAAPSIGVKSLNRNLSLGSNSQDVIVLQRYLNAQGFTVSLSGAGSVGNESQYFGLKTKQALIRFQKSHNIKPASGLFGPITRAAVKVL